MKYLMQTQDRFACSNLKVKIGILECMQAVEGGIFTMQCFPLMWNTSIGITI